MTKTRAVKSQASPRSTKKAQLIRMLSAKSGADVAAISGKLGWQSHTTRAAITGLRKAGYEVSAERETGKPARYRIVPAPKVARDVSTSSSESVVAPEPADAG